MINQVNLMKMQRRFKDLGIEGMTAHWYDKDTRKHRLAEMKDYAKEVASHLKDGDSVLEVAPGPGFLAIELARLGNYRIVGLDISNDFVEIARRNAKDADVQVEFRRGNAADIPFPDNTFNFIICTAAFKNFKEPLKALNEIYRVLTVRGAALIIDMNRNASDSQIEDYIQHLIVGGLDRFFMKMIFMYFLRNGAYTKEEFVHLISGSPFREYDVRESGIGFYVSLQK